ncbi:MAG: AAA family ATPase [Gemmataceae bacterium]|nr:AAA family ATPase [Gemmataceae bacterium]
MTFEQELAVYLRARFTLLVLVTPEEERVLKAVKAACERLKRPCLAWDIADHFQPLTAGAQAPGTPTRDPLAALEHIDKADSEAVYVLKDFHECWGNAQIKRKLRGVAQRLKFTRKSILITAPAAKVPDELRDEAVVVEFPPPTEPELGEVLDRLTQVPGVKVQLTALGRDKLVQAALGLSAAQAQRVFAKAIVSDGVLDDRGIALVTDEKKQIIRESEALEFYPVTETLADVGGLGVLKQWLRLRERAFTQEARAYGLPAPRGIALLGIPGTGKSLTAKLIGGLWQQPLLRLDVGALFGSLVGESEERTRRALRVAETCAPCVAGESRVTLADGSERTIESLYDDPGDDLRVLGLTDRLAFQPVRILAVTRRAPPDLYRVQLRHGELRATGNHLHPVLRDGRLCWVRTDALTEKDHVAVARQIPTREDYPSLLEFLPAQARLYAEGALRFARAECVPPSRRRKARVRGVEYVRISELASTECYPALETVKQVVLGRGGTTDSKLPRLPERLNDEIGYLLGLITSDGSLGKRNRVMFVNTHPALHRRFAELMEQQFGLVVACRLGPVPHVDYEVKLPGTSKESVFAPCYNSFVDNLLLRRLLGNIRDQLLRLPAGFLRAWLRGHFDGDGCISAPGRDPKCTLTAKVPAINRLLRAVLQRLGFPTTNPGRAAIEITGLNNVLRFIKEVGSSHPKKRQRMDAWLGQTVAEPKDRTDVIPAGARLRAARQQLGMGSHHFRETRSSLISSYERGLFHPNRARLHSLLAEMRGWAVSRQLDVRPVDDLQALVDAPVLWSRVQAVTAEPPTEFVYDLVCEGPHTFIANGIVTHNCLLWVDEIEKALAQGDLDGGTSTRVLGTILTWMQEKKAPVFVVATANNISSLPPELLRKGRFDEIFFLDLPTREERKEIFAIHLAKRRRLPRDYDLDRLAHESERYVGAEIEQALIEAMYVGFNAGREFTTDDIAAALRRQVPLSVSARETIGMLRDWLREGRAQSASFQEAREAEQQFVPLQLEPSAPGPRGE